jgi:hypothetical protein
VSASVEVDGDQFYISLVAALAEMDDKLFLVTENTGARVARDVAGLAPWRRIKKTVRHKTRRAGSVQTATITSGSLSVWAEFGTRAHIIRPVTARVLRFVGRNGAVVFARVVHHPGTRPIPFFRKGTERTRVLEHMRRAVRTVFG